MNNRQVVALAAEVMYDPAHFSPHNPECRALVAAAVAGFLSQAERAAKEESGADYEFGQAVTVYDCAEAALKDAQTAQGLWAASEITRLHLAPLLGPRTGAQDFSSTRRAVLVIALEMQGDAEAHADNIVEFLAEVLMELETEAGNRGDSGLYRFTGELTFYTAIAEAVADEQEQLDLWQVA